MHDVGPRLPDHVRQRERQQHRDAACRPHHVELIESIARRGAQPTGSTTQRDERDADGCTVEPRRHLRDERLQTTAVEVEHDVRDANGRPRAPWNVGA